MKKWLVQISWILFKQYSNTSKKKFLVTYLHKEELTLLLLKKLGNNCYLNLKFLKDQVWAFIRQALSLLFVYWIAELIALGNIRPEEFLSTYLLYFLWLLCLYPCALHSVKDIKCLPTATYTSNNCYQDQTAYKSTLNMSLLTPAALLWTSAYTDVDNIYLSFPSSGKWEYYYAIWLHAQLAYRNAKCVCVCVCVGGSLLKKN
jgi:hypothetical protein